ncbi:hypothetical protein [Consotaella aegiceratis]
MAQDDEENEMRVETFVAIFVNTVFFGMILGVSAVGAVILFP